MPRPPARCLVWQVSFENFLSGDEAERIISVGAKGWQRSQVAPSPDGRARTTRRTVSSLMSSLLCFCSAAME
jgi:hypothetical protein